MSVLLSEKFGLLFAVNVGIIFIFVFDFLFALLIYFYEKKYYKKYNIKKRRNSILTYGLNLFSIGISCDDKVLVNILLKSKIKKIGKSFIILLLVFICSVVFSSFGYFDVIETNLIYILLLSIFVLFQIEKYLLFFRIKKGYYGKNKFEILKIASFIYSHKNINDFTNSNGKRKQVLKNQEIRKKYKLKFGKEGLIKWV